MPRVCHTACLIFVVSGSATNYSSDQSGCAGHTYNAGENFVDEGGDHVHMLLDPSGTETAETIAVQILPHGAPRKTSADEPTAVATSGIVQRERSRMPVSTTAI